MKKPENPHVDLQRYDSWQEGVDTMYEIALKEIKQRDERIKKHGEVIDELTDAIYMLNSKYPYIAQTLREYDEWKRKQK